MENTFHMSFASSLTNLCEVNSSFDSGVLKICYTGQNRNKSYFSREDIERNINTIFNCPLVANYDIESGTFGGHDMQVIRDADNNVRIINSTEPVGVIPESSHVWFEQGNDENGTPHEYLYADVLLWKRQAAYDKIKKDGIIKQSMEVSVKNGEIIDGIYHIHDFEFTAFALLGDDVEPCFESSALEVFSASEFKQSMSEMMRDLKDTYNSIDASNGADDKNKVDVEGGEEVLDEKVELAKKYSINIEDLDFNINDFSIDELIEKFEALRSDAKKANEFALISNIVEEINHALSEQKIMREWGECDRYRYIDVDCDTKEIYCMDCKDWLMYGFTYSMDNDKVIIDFESKKRKKYVITDFIDGETQPSLFAEDFTLVSSELKKAIESRDTFEAKLSDEARRSAEFEKELDDLRKYKSNVEFAQENAKRDAVFKRFEKLNGNEAFENLKVNCNDLSIEEIEDKCFAIKGRIYDAAEKDPKFSLDLTASKILVDKSADNGGKTEPYNGVFAKYGY